MSVSNPCLSCGACCAFFRVSFYWAETDVAADGTVPGHLTEAVSPHLSAMRGTNRPTPRCVSLQGTIGEQVSCSIHPLRSSSCRDFALSWEDGLHNPDCDRARAHHGLAPVQAPVPLPMERVFPLHVIADLPAPPQQQDASLPSESA